MKNHQPFQNVLMVSIIIICLVGLIFVVNSPIGITFSSYSTLPITSALKQQATIEIDNPKIAVTDIQTKLKLLGYYHDAIDGLYGKNTRSAISKFQEVNGLKVDGIVGPITWKNLVKQVQDRQVLITKNQPLEKSGNQPKRSEFFWHLIGGFTSVIVILGLAVVALYKFPVISLIFKQRILQLPVIFSLISLMLFLGIANSEKPRLLILHSYATDFAWVQDINVGITRIIEKQPYSVQYHYMDTKRNPSEVFKSKAVRTAKKLIEQLQPNVIIAVDDNAQEVAKQFINSPNIKIVFAGLNANPEDYGYDKANNVTGILERIPFDSIKDAFLQILPPDRRKIVHYSDDSETSDAIHKEMEEFDWSPINLVEHKELATFEEWKNTIKEAPKKADFLLITHYHTIRNSATSDKVVPPSEVMKWTVENSGIPDVGCWGFYVKDGGMIAFGVSPYEQGEVAAQMAIDMIINKKLPTEIPYVKSKLYVIYARDSRLKQYGVNLPSVYEAFAYATNNYYN